MFTADDIQRRVRQQPFQPLRIVTSSGQSFDVLHPELIMIGRRDLTVGVPRSDNPTQYDQISRIAILHVSALQDLPAGAPPGKNGPS
jgi:hypothetical protein